MSIRCLLVAAAAGFPLLLPTGCGVHSPFSSPQQTADIAGHNPSTIQSAGMGFADRYLSAMADAYDKVKAAAPGPEAKLEAQQQKIQAALGALGNAVNPNPLAGLMDTAILVTLTRQTTEEPWARDTFGAEGVATILAAIKPQEADIWRVAGTFLSADQVKELRQLASQWRREHSGQRYLAGVRLASFPQADRTPGPGLGIANSVFAIIRLDPFAGLDPAVRQVEESRILGERVFFYTRHMSFLVSWQAQALYMQMLDAPQIKQALADTTRFTDDTTRFTDATREFADSSSRVAETVEKFRADLPAQQATLIEQLNGLVARQRDEALKQATAEIAAQRDAALKQAAAEIAAERKAAINQLNVAIVKQQDLMSQNLQQLADHSIDRLYARARSLISIAIGGLIGAVLLFGIIVGVLRRRSPQPGSAPIAS